METTETNVKDQEESEDKVSFSQVTSVVTDWMVDFLFLSLCRSFKEGNLEEFDKNMSVLEAISEDLPRNEKFVVCAFLGRVMHGKELDVFFEEDDNKVTPLMSAAKIWSDLMKRVEDESLAKNLMILLFVQSVAVSLEKASNPSYVIQWFEENLEFPSALRIKLGTVVAQKDNYHPFIMTFSYSRLLETTQAFLNTFLEKNPSDYLLKAGTKAVQSSEKRDTRTDAEPEDDVQTMETTAEVNKESKRTLLSTKISDLWAPELSEKPFVCLTRITQKNSLKKSDNADAMNTRETKTTRRRRMKWKYDDDKKLIAGVERHGVGQWTHILQDFDFGDRTSIMLKDRWRTLRKLDMV